MNTRERKRNLFWMIIVLSIFFMGAGLCRNSIDKMDYHCSTHDLGNLPSADTPPEQMHGHLGYIAYLYQFHRLPQGDPRQQQCFYNPPLFYVSEAVLWGILSRAGQSEQQMQEALQWIPCFCAIASMAVMIAILWKLKIRKLPLALMAVLICFFPSFQILALMVNPDAMSFLLLLLTIFLTLVWYEKPGMIKAVLLGLAFGLGMMTKLSNALAAPAVAVVFCMVFFTGQDRDSRKISRRALSIQYVLFLLVSVPTGMFWYIRNDLRFGMPMSYVPSMSQIDWLCIAPENLGIGKRLGWPSAALFQEIHFVMSPDLQYNIWAQTFKTALVDEKYLVCNTAFSGQLLHQVLVLSMVLAIVLNIMFLWVVFRNHRINRLQKAFFLLLYGTVLGNYINFCFVYPQTCTMNYRYIPVTLLFSCIGGGLIWEDLNTKKWGRVIQIGLTVFIISFSAGSALLYLTQLYEIS